MIGTKVMALRTESYAEKVYAGVLGKIIGVYLGRPIEGWDYRKIVARFGQIDRYVHEACGVPLIVTDDDITGTFTFLRALDDHAEAGADLTAEQIGRTWLNYIIENRTILWWGGFGLSTEHTAFLRLQRGIPAPHSGSARLNGKIMSEQIGAQIFIDGWAMVSPGDPDRAASLARRAASVSHDGEAVYAAQVIAAMEALAFVEPNLNRLLDVAVGYIPKDSIVYRLIDDLREHRGKTDDWHDAMTTLVERRYGYDRYGGNCHVIPNHALVMLALLWGDDDFSRSLMIANTCGWDTDCNSANVGCLLGIKNGLAAIDAGWRGPVADRLLLPTGDGGRCVRDAVTVALDIENIGRRLGGLPPRSPKEGAKFHFSMPGSVQGFVPDDDAAGQTVARHDGGRLHIGFTPDAIGPIARAATATFLEPAGLNEKAYAAVGSPTLYTGQHLRTTVEACPDNAAPVEVRLYIAHYNAADAFERLPGPARSLQPGEQATLTWILPPTDGQPIAQVGFEVVRQGAGACGVFVDRLHWDGTPTLTFHRPAGGWAWTKAWTCGVSSVTAWEPAYYLRFLQNHGRGLITIGTEDWTDYRVTTTLRPFLATSFGVAARAQGLRRYYALLLCIAGEKRVARLVKMRDVEHVLAEVPFDWTEDQSYTFDLQAVGTELVGTIDGRAELRAQDATLPFVNGGIGLVIEEGRAHAGDVQVTAIVP